MRSEAVPNPSYLKMPYVESRVYRTHLISSIESEKSRRYTILHQLMNSIDAIKLDSPRARHRIQPAGC
jgi:hypothetical protein